MARRSATPAASLMTPSPNTRLNKMGLRSLSSTCSTATESVVAKMAPNARMSWIQTDFSTDGQRHRQHRQVSTMQRLHTFISKAACRLTHRQTPQRSQQAKAFKAMSGVCDDRFATVFFKLLMAL